MWGNNNQPNPIAQQVDTLLAGLTCYPQKSRVRNDVIALSHQIVTLQPHVDELVQNDGSRHRILNLSGTIPIYYKGREYNIPVRIWFLETYPSTPPQCYVTPTHDMRIKPRHKHVDDQGVVYLPYLHTWSISSRLADLVGFMSSVFSADPPVFKYNPQAQAQAKAQPAFPHVAQTQQQQQHHQVYPNNVNNNSNHNNNININHNNIRNSSITNQQLPNGAVVVNGQVPGGVIVQPSSIGEQKGGKNWQDTLRASLVQKVTSRIQTKLAATNKSITGEMDSLFETQSKLETGSKKISSDLTMLRQTKQQLETASAALSNQNTQLESWLEENESKELPHVDKLVYFHDTWSKQLFQAVAKDHAVGDALYKLDRALADDKIELKSFLKQVRSLSRKQFMSRALATKINAKQEEAAQGNATDPSIRVASSSLDLGAHGLSVPNNNSNNHNNHQPSPQVSPYHNPSPTPSVGVHQMII